LTKFVGSGLGVGFGYGPPSERSDVAFGKVGITAPTLDKKIHRSEKITTDSEQINSQSTYIHGKIQQCCCIRVVVHGIAQFGNILEELDTVVFQKP
jgi:hypothetical protein